MPSVPVAIVDLLESLLDAEQNSLFRFMEDGSPYLNRAAAEVKRPLTEMVRSGDRRSQLLAGLINALGGVPSPPRMRSGEQYLAYLSLQFLLPKLVDDKRLTVQRYENALRALGDGKGAIEARDLVARLLAEHRDELAMLLAAMK